MFIRWIVTTITIKKLKVYSEELIFLISVYYGYLVTFNKLDYVFSPLINDPSLSNIAIKVNPIDEYLMEIDFVLFVLNAF